MDDLIRSGPHDLQVVEEDGVFCLCFQGEPVLTSKGERVCHHTPHLLQHMIDEFDHQGDIAVRAGVIEEPRFFSAYALYKIQKEWIQNNEDELSTQFAEELVRDGMLFRSAGPEVADQWCRWGPVLEFLKENELTLPNLSGPFFDDPEMYANEEEYLAARDMATPDPGFVSKLSHLYRSLSESQRTVVMFLHAIHDGVVLFPLVLALGRCNPNEYASGVIAANFAIAGVFSDITTDDHKAMFSTIKENARTSLEYLDYFSRPLEVLAPELQSISDELKAGEGKYREFKSTLRWNIKAQKNDDAMTHACLKTIAAFLNSGGGVLFIGVNDDGEPIGLELDKFENKDRFSLHLFNVIKQSMGDAAGILVDAKFHELNGKEFCRVACGEAPPESPVFVRYKKGEEEFFVRTGPGTTRLTPSEALRFIRDRTKL